MHPSFRRAGVRLGAAAVLLVAASPAAAADPPAGRIGPLNSATQDSVSTQVRYVEVGGATFFAVNDDVHGTELFKHVAGKDPVLVRDIMPGAEPSDPEDLVAFDGELYFTARSATGRELWRSDGTTAGTQEVKDIRPGNASSGPDELAVAGDQLFFKADDGTTGVDLWVSDGTAAGTELVEDLDTGTGLYGITAFGTKAIFSADGEAWISDGTAGGTSALGDVWAGGASNPSKFTVVGGFAYFIARDGTPGLNPRTLFRTDGTNPPERVLEFAGNGTSVNDVFASGSRLYVAVNYGYPELFTLDEEPGEEPEMRRVSGSAFAVSAPVPDGTGGAYFSGYPAPYDFSTMELYRTDGAAASPTKLTSGFGPISPGALFDGNYYFSNVGEDGGLWVTDGTSADAPHTALVTGTEGLETGRASASTAGVYFAATTAAEGREPWLLAVGEDPAPLGDLNRGLRGDNVDEIAGAGQTGFFTARTPATGFELFRTDGVDAELVADIEPDGDSYPSQLTAFGDELVFKAYDSDGGNEPWITTGGGTDAERLLDVEPGSGGSDPEGFVVGGDELWFAARVDGDPTLFRSDGTTAGTEAVTMLACCGDFEPIGYADGKLWFVLDDGQLWSSDGTENGTRQVALPDGREADFGTIAKDTVYVAAGAALVKVAPGAAPALVADPGGYGIEELVALGSRVVFSSTSSVGRRGGPRQAHLWISDGTTTTELGDASLSEITT